ncbi:MAG: helix-turn-helix domain-containing protein [Planctomycetes bacterium]|nr:helix-turn-helix domain-containing protein [Planctomycetota bacterium]MBU4400393.1 helix-turn-helix domain-containing protein [Planctomycetota bacterium]MCG2682587.1 helix-turn-helix domain-containing protein [Planctomycetales bacterium]
MSTAQTPSPTARRRLTVRRKFTPPEIAKLWGVDTLKVLRWIRAGELRAINASTRRDSKKPRFLIDPADLAAFEASRAVQPPVPRVRRRKADPSITQFF